MFELAARAFELRGTWSRFGTDMYDMRVAPFEVRAAVFKSRGSVSELHELKKMLVVALWTVRARLLKAHAPF